jgi:hypothetical protein
MPAADARSRSSSPYAVEQLAVNLNRSQLGAWWRWRTELALFLVVSGWFSWGWRQLGSWLWPLVILAGTVLVLVLMPMSRRFLAGRFWALFTRHRLQRSFWELRLHSRAGRLPLIAWISPTPVGVRALVLLRAGMTFEDFEDSAAAFAVACGARDCRVTASARSSWLLRIDIIRRDVLGPARVIRSPLVIVPAAAVAPVWPERALPED